MKTKALSSCIGLCITVNAQQVTPVFRYKVLVSSAQIVGTHSLTPDTVIDGIALNNTGDVAFVAQWLDGGRDRTAVFTSKRVVASDGDSFDGKTLKRINGTALAINSAGQVAFEAICGEPAQVCIFIERKFSAAISSSGSPEDFALSDDGKVRLVAGVAANAVTIPARSESKPTTTDWQKAISGVRLPRSVQRAMQRPNSPIPQIDPNVILQQMGRSQTPAKPVPTKADSAKPAVPAKSEVTARPCPAPEFVYPSSWRIGDESAGPITSRIFEPPLKGRVYDSPFFGKMLSPFRSVQFGSGSDCKPLLVVIGDTAQPGKVEIYTPNGLLTYTKADGYLDLPGYSGKVKPGSLARNDTPIKINKRGQIAIPVNVDPEGFAILLGTPTGR